MVFLAPLIILQVECATQKKQTYEITNSMRSVAPPMMQGQQPTPIVPAYVKNAPAVASHQHGAQAAPIVTTAPTELSAPQELNVNAKVIIFLILIFHSTKNLYFFFG